MLMTGEGRATEKETPMRIPGRRSQKPSLTVAYGRSSHV